jgi:hypothetical protein
VIFVSAVDYEDKLGLKAARAGEARHEIMEM